MSNWIQYKYRSLWQHPLWAELQRVSKREFWTLDNKHSTALVIKHSLPFGLSWLEVPRGPLFTDEISRGEVLKRIEDLGREQKAVFIRYSCYEELSGQRIVPTQYDHHPTTSLIIDLSQTEDEILAQMKPKGRYNIRLAEKRGVTVQASDDLDSFYNILSTTGNRDGFHIHPKEYYQNMLTVLGDNAQLLLASYEGRVIAGGIFVYLDEWGIYYYGASDHRYRNVMAPYLVQWNAIQEAKKRACKFYDFLGIAPDGAINHAWDGVTEFKKKFGGRVVNYPQAKDFILRPIWYFLYKLRKLTS